MLRHARLAERVRPASTVLTSVARDWVIAPVSRRRKILAVAGTALAMVSVGTASAATTTASAPAARAPAVRTAAARPAAAARSAPPLHVPRHVLIAADLLRPAAPHPAPGTPAAPPAAPTWQQVSAAFSAPGAPAAAAQLTPAGTSGPQGSMPIDGAQYANASTIVQQVLARKMGIRSAVIAIATAMQESRLQNLPYGSADSLGLFQQRPSAGWGAPQQLLDPAYAANAFLTALGRYQQANPGWASQPLWSSAQAVQASGFPTAYARWESQAANMVQQIATSLL